MRRLYPCAVISFLFVLIQSPKLLAQIDSTCTTPNYWTAHRAKAIYIEALGTSIGYSLHYDMRFRRGHRGLGMNIGLNRPLESGQTKTYSMSLIVNHISSNQRIALEVGGGFLLAYRRRIFDDVNNRIHRTNSFYYPAVANLGIRFQPKRIGPVLKLFWSPNWNIDKSSSQQITLRWFGASLGLGF